MLCATNKEVTSTNKRIMANMLTGREYSFRSADNVMQDENDRAVYTTEYLNTIDLSGLPPHNLKVKVGCVLMLLRNLSPRDGLCNGTRILLTKAGDHTLEGVILTGL